MRACRPLYYFMVKLPGSLVDEGYEGLAQEEISWRNHATFANSAGAPARQCRNPQPDPNGDPTLGFWEVETCSLRDFPQQFRTFDLRRNQDNTVSIIITNVDPAVQAGSPAYKSRGYAIGAARVYATYPPNDTASQSYNAELVVQLTPVMQAIISEAGTALK